MGFVIKCNGGYLGINNGKYFKTNKHNKACHWKKQESAANVMKSLQRSKSFEEHSLEVEQDESFYFDDDELSLKDEFEKLKAVADVLSLKKTKLNCQLSEIDKEICDIMHIAEFNELNVVQGYKVYKTLHDARLKRRKIKDNIEKINILQSTGLTADFSSSVSKKIEGLYNRSYTPRTDTDAFSILA